MKGREGPARGAPGSAARGYLFALAATALWSVNFLVARGLSGRISPLSLAFLRWSVALLAFLPFALAGFLRERRAVRRHLGYLSLCALLAVSLFNTLIYYAGRTTAALNLSLISLSSPMFILLFGRVFLKERIGPARAAGLLIALSGVLLLLAGGRPGGLSGLRFQAGDLLMLLAASLFAAYSLLLRRRPPELSLVGFQFSTFALGLLFLLPAFLADRALGPPLALDGLSVAAILYIGVFASLAAFVSWNRAVELVGAARAGMVYYVLPIFSGLLAFLFLGEPVGAAQVGSMGLIVAGIALANRG